MNRLLGLLVVLSVIGVNQLFACKVGEQRFCSNFKNVVCGITIYCNPNGGGLETLCDGIMKEDIGAMSWGNCERPKITADNSSKYPDGQLRFWRGDSKNCSVGTRSTNATGTAIGTGLDNTKKIVAKYGAGKYAALACYILNLKTGGGVWYLPSEDELKLINDAGTKKIISIHEQYWSSSESPKYEEGDDAAVLLVQGDPNVPLLWSKADGNMVRCIRDVK